MRPRGKKRNNAPSATDQLFYIEQKRCDQEIINYINEIIHELGKKMVFVETEQGSTENLERQDRTL